MCRYWYSARTLQSLIEELLACGATRGAFLSTPSVYFSLPKVRLFYKLLYWPSRKHWQSTSSRRYLCYGMPAFLQDSELRKSSWVFDYDEQWRKDPHFCK
jgi:hypothetical protein